MAKLPLARTIALAGEKCVEFAGCTEPVTLDTPIGKREFVIAELRRDEPGEWYRIVDVATGCSLFPPYEVASLEYPAHTVSWMLTARIYGRTEPQWRAAIARAKEHVETRGLTGIGMVEPVGNAGSAPVSRPAPRRAADQDDLFGGLFA